LSEEKAAADEARRVIEERKKADEAKRLSEEVERRRAVEDEERKRAAVVQNARVQQHSRPIDQKEIKTGPSHLDIDQEETQAQERDDSPRLFGNDPDEALTQAQEVVVPVTPPRGSKRKHVFPTDEDLNSSGKKKCEYPIQKDLKGLQKRLREEREAQAKLIESLLASQTRVDDLLNDIVETATTMFECT